MARYWIGFYCGQDEINVSGGTYTYPDRVLVCASDCGCCDSIVNNSDDITMRAVSKSHYDSCLAAMNTDGKFATWGTDATQDADTGLWSATITLYDEVEAV